MDDSTTTIVPKGTAHGKNPVLSHLQLLLLKLKRVVLLRPPPQELPEVTLEAPILQW